MQERSNEGAGFRLSWTIEETAERNDGRGNQVKPKGLNRSLDWLKAINETLFPPLPDCPLCRQSLSIYGKAQGRTGICRRCDEELSQSRNDYLQCPRCGKYKEYKGKPHTCSVPSGTLCSNCTEQEPRFIRAWNIGPYQGILRQSVHDLKYRGYRQIAEVFGIMMADRLWSAVPGSTWLNPWGHLRNAVLVPIPLHPEKLYRRNFNQALRLAEVIGRETGLPVVDILARRDDRTAQAHLNRQERMHNLKGQFYLIDSVEDLGKKSFARTAAIIVDDVYTTGATVAEAAITLSGAGIKETYVLTVAAGVGN
ncbi:hypothetical protein GJ688_13155 [Heliobacillus mobilis]|uniref:ComF family protein n=1 Tax=Heliobacterium mobile TaxID=28064 RepID=A0A6I3SN14_HELMO|nr:ComF family protein [Heliobacterium mobile]MTV49922.1 hypothetical protein [Heliobacterium mobile]